MLSGSLLKPGHYAAVVSQSSAGCFATTRLRHGKPCRSQAGGSGARLGGDELPCLWLVLTAAVNSGLAISYVLAWRDQGFRAVEPSCKPGPDFEVCRQGQLLSSAGHLIWVVAAFAITGFACWFALSGRLNLALVTLEQKIRSMRKSGKK